MGKSKRNDANNCPLRLWPPKQASGFGPVWVILEPVSPFLWSHKGSEWPQILYSGTKYYYIVVVGAFGGHVGTFRDISE